MQSLLQWFMHWCKISGMLVEFLVSPIFSTCPTVVNLMKNWVLMHKVSFIFLLKNTHVGPRALPLQQQLWDSMVLEY